MKFKFPSIDKYVRPDEKVFKGDENAKEYINIPTLMGSMDIGFVQVFKMRFPILPKMIRCMLESQKSASSITQNPHKNKNTISAQELHDLESYIQSLGIDLIGYTKVDPQYIFRNHSILYDNAIVLVMQMEKNIISTAPSKPVLKEVFRTYLELGIIVNNIADYLRERGYNAMAGPAIGGDASYVPLAEQAGLGAIGKHGLLITEQDFGPSLRLATVYTDIDNLPIFTDENPHLWIKDFCEKCNKCVRSCPANAINKDRNVQGVCIDTMKCALPFASHFGCTVCVKSCTFFDGSYEKIKNTKTSPI